MFGTDTSASSNQTSSSGGAQPQQVASHPTTDTTRYVTVSSGRQLKA